MNMRLKSLQSALLLAVFLTGSVTAQDKTKQKTTQSKSDDSQQIIITKDKSKNEKMTIVIDGDKITVNGKPAAEFKDGNLTIHSGSGEDNWWGYNYDGSPEIYLKTNPHVITTIPRYKYNYNYNYEPKINTTVSGPMLGATSKDNSKGAEITEVVDGSAAEKAGFKVGDIITKVGDKTVTDPKSLSAAVRNYKPNETVNITYLRAGKSKTIPVKLGERKSDSFSFNFENPDAFKEFHSPEIYGFDKHGDLNEWNFFGRPRLGMRIQDTENEDGVTVLDVTEGSPAEKAGVKKDDKIVEIDGKAVKNADDVNDYLKDNREKSTYPLKLMRGGSPMSIDVKIPKKLKTSDL